MIGSWLMRVRRSVRGKLVAMALLLTVLVLLLAGVLLLINDLSIYRHSWAEDVSAEASILGTATAPALAFLDHDAATRTLTALRARPNVRLAAIYDARGELFAQYLRDADTPRLAGSGKLEPGIQVIGERVLVTQPISLDGEPLGTIFLEARYDIRARVVAFAAIFAMVSALGIGLALLLSLYLRRALTLPLEEIADVARGVIDRRDYSRRARASSNDEIAIVVQAFNEMLDAEEQRRTSERVYRAVGESLAYGVWITDATGRCTYVSDSFLQLLGMTQEQCSAFGWTARLHPDEREATMAAWLQCVREGRPWYREHRLLGADNQYHPVLAQGVPIRRDDGSLAGWAGINLDIRRMKETEAALREVDRRKDEFLATLAHELRNPLAPISQAAQLLGVPAVNDQQREWARQVIARQAQHMALLLNDLLDVSRITRGRFELRREYVSLEHIYGAAIETAKPLIESRRHDLIVRVPPQPLTLNADPLRLSQALSNLLTNAAKYTDEGGRIALTIELSAGGLDFIVSDNGIGIAPADQAQIFGMFAQVQSALERSQGGLGIGLALVKGLVELHGGSVAVRSEGVRQGSTFTIHLPPSILATAPAAPQPHEIGLLPRGGPHCRILIVDDNKDAADSLASALSVLNYEVRVGYSGVQALQILEEFNPDVAILDIGMPLMNGYQLAQAIAKRSGQRPALLVALTGWGQEEDIERSRAAGFDVHLKKPADLAELEKVLAAVSRRSDGEASGSH